MGGACIGSTRLFLPRLATHQSQEKRGKKRLERMVHVYLSRVGGVRLLGGKKKALDLRSRHHLCLTTGIHGTAPPALSAKAVDKAFGKGKRHVDYYYN